MLTFTIQKYRKKPNTNLKIVFAFLLQVKILEYYLGCSGWNYGDTPEKGGWLDIFYPKKDTKRLRYYSEFFNTVEMDSTFYEEFYSKMTKGLFFWYGESNSPEF